MMSWMDSRMTAQREDVERGRGIPTRTRRGHAVRRIVGIVRLLVRRSS